MESIVVDTDIELGEWPQEFSGAWMYIYYDFPTTDTVMCLFFDSDFEEGTVIEGYRPTIQIPSAYVSWKEDGVCRDIFVHPDFRRLGVGSKLCAYARSYLLKEDKVFNAPETMSAAADGMYEKISEVYGEPYHTPNVVSHPIPYGYWGGYLV
jgi:GNAT superfamily N-acetyltransferase